MNIIDRTEFDKRLLELSENMPNDTLKRLLEIDGGYDAWPTHLKKDACKRLGVCPEMVFRIESGRNLE